jgi:hypothetical protein
VSGGTEGDRAPYMYGELVRARATACHLPCMEWQQHRCQTPRLPGNQQTGHCCFVHRWLLAHCRVTRLTHDTFFAPPIHL